MKRILAATLMCLLLSGCVRQAPPDTTAAVTTLPPTTQAAETTAVTETTAPARKYLVVIDAGHQAKGDPEKEPIGPGSTVMKAKVSSGTTGCVTGIPEHELNLAVALMLRDILLERGYEVVMIRTVADVSISNSQRAQTANDLGADAFIRIHANSADDSSVCGMLTICQTPDNPYNADLYEQSFLLSRLVLDEMVLSTGAERRNVWETDTMSGINWCRVPVTIVEMGFMSNEEEDILLSSDEYRLLIAQGIANGIDSYFGVIAESG